MVPISVEPNIRRAARPTMRIDSVPSSATENRQPNELVTPNSCSPAAMTHLPTGGCTTRSGTSPNTSGVPFVNITSGFLIVSGTRRSVPNCSSDQACLT